MTSLDPTASLGLSMPQNKARVISRAEFGVGDVGHLDTALLQGESTNLNIADPASGTASFMRAEANAAATSRLFGVTADAIGDNQRGPVHMSGLVPLQVSGSGTAGQSITFGPPNLKGARVNAIALESWSSATTINALFNGWSGFGVYLEEDAVNTPPTVTISAPTDEAYYEVNVNVEVTFTATATDAEDGDLTATIDWYKKDPDESSYSLWKTNDASFTHTFTEVGTYLIYAYVEDSGSLTDIDPIAVVVRTASGGHPPPGTNDNPISLV